MLRHCYTNHRTRGKIKLWVKDANLWRGDSTINGVEKHGTDIFKVLRSFWKSQNCTLHYCCSAFREETHSFFHIGFFITILNCLTAVFLPNISFNSISSEMELKWSWRIFRLTPHLERKIELGKRRRGKGNSTNMIDW